MTKFEGKTVQQAITLGLTTLALTEEQADITVLRQAKKGFLGLGKKLALVEVSAKKVPVAKKAPVSEPVKTAPVTESDEAKREKRQAELEKALLAVGDYLAAVTQKMGIKATIDLTPSRHTAYYKFETNQEGLLIGKRGRTLNALQLLAQDYLDKQVHQHVRVMLDVSDYRKQRQETLTHLAQNVAREAVLARSVMTLDPMPAYERKIIHAALAQDQRVQTYSKGSEPKRYVVIEPI